MSDSENTEQQEGQQPEGGNTDASLPNPPTSEEATPAIHGLIRLEAARTLPVLTQGQADEAGAHPFTASVPTEIEAFRAEDGSTCRVAVVDSKLVAVIVEQGDAQ